MVAQRSCTLPRPVALGIAVGFLVLVTFILGSVDDPMSLIFIKDGSPSRWGRGVPYDKDLRLLFCVLAGRPHIETRLVAALKTWLADHDSIAFIEDGPSSREAFNTHILKNEGISASTKSRVSAVYLPEPADRKLRAFNGAWKNFEIVKHVAAMRALDLTADDHHSTYDFIVIVDDDTFVLQRNLNIYLTATIPPPRPRRRGSDRQAIAIHAGAVMTYVQMTFVQGGAGIVLTPSAIDLLMTAMPQCEAECQQFAGDVRLGCCAHRVGLPMISNWGFWSMNPMKTVLVDRRQRVTNSYPVTFHQLRNTSWVTDLHRDVTESCFVAERCREVAWLRGTSCCAHFKKHGYDSIAPPQPIRWDAIVAWVGQYSFERHKAL